MNEEILDGSALTFQMLPDVGYALDTLFDNGVDVTSQVVNNIYVISSLHEVHSLDAVFQ